MWHGWVPSAASHMRERRRERWESEREKDRMEMHFQCIWVYMFLNNAFLLCCLSLCMIFKCVIMMGTALHLLRQYGFMRNAENYQPPNQRELEMKFIHEGLVFNFSTKCLFFSPQSVWALVCDCMSSCVKVNVWSSASPCLMGNKTKQVIHGLLIRNVMIM